MQLWSRRVAASPLRYIAGLPRGCARPEGGCRLRIPRVELAFLVAGIPLLVGCAGTGAPPAAAPEMVGAPQAPASPRDEADEAIAAALERALSGSGAWESLRLFTECRRDGGLESIEIYGNGVAIWDNRLQFEVSGAEISTLLAALHEADFAAMPETFGGKTRPRDPQEPPGPPDGEQAIFALRVICRVELSLEGRTKRVAQLDEGRQSAELRELSEEFFRVCKEPARQAVGASGLADGLDKIGRGELAPEVLRVMLHRKPDPNEPVSSEGFLLRLEGPKVTSRLVEESGGYGPPMELTLSAGELQELARELAGWTLEELPVNLYSLEYTDFMAAVLDRSKSVQARQFAGMSPTTHAEAQRRFDALYTRLFDVHRRVRAEGATVPD